LYDRANGVWASLCAAGFVPPSDSVRFSYLLSSESGNVSAVRGVPTAGFSGSCAADCSWTTNIV